MAPLLFGVLFIYAVVILPSAFIIAMLVYLFKGSGFWKALWYINLTFFFIFLFLLLMVGGH